MKYALLALASTTAFAVDIPFYIGTYTKPGGSQGIYRATIDSETGKMSEPKLAAQSKNPSFLAVDLKGRYVFAANEGDGPTVSAYAVQPDGMLKPLNQSSAKGAGPCHVWVDGAGKNVLVANYGGGSVASLPIRADGSVGDATAFVQHTGSSVNPSRQKEPHAHGIYLSPDDRFAYVPDLGQDKVMIYQFDAEKGTLTPTIRRPASFRPAAARGTSRSIRRAASPTSSMKCSRPSPPSSTTPRPAR